MLEQFGMSFPIVAAPMSGGPTTPAMVCAATRAGGLAFGINVFAPNPLPVDPERYRTYAAIIQREADQFGLTLPPDPIEDNDRFDDKIALLLDDPVPVVSFTFGIPPDAVISALQQANSLVMQTVTTPD